MQRLSTTVFSMTTGMARCAGNSLGWVCARNKDELVGFVNVAWDGGAHAFILDAIVKISGDKESALSS
jgi:hypothetical protein